MGPKRNLYESQAEFGDIACTAEVSYDKKQQQKQKQGRSFLMLAHSVTKVNNSQITDKCVAAIPT